MRPSYLKRGFVQLELPELAVRSTAIPSLASRGPSSQPNLMSSKRTTSVDNPGPHREPGTFRALHTTFVAVAKPVCTQATRCCLASELVEAQVAPKTADFKSWRASSSFRIRLASLMTHSLMTHYVRGQQGDKVAWFHPIRAEGQSFNELTMWALATLMCKLQPNVYLT